MARTLLLLIVAILLSLLASYFLAKRLSRPILALRQGASRIASGQLDQIIPVKTGDEIQALAGDFNVMATKLKESYAGLEAKVAMRTRELEKVTETANMQAQELKVLNSELSASIAELEVRKDESDRANAAKTRFLAAASHDLRQPMHAIGLLVGVLHDQVRESPLASLAAKIESSVKAMEMLFSGLLDISKLDAHAVSTNVCAFQIAQVLRNIYDSYSTIASQKNIKLAVVYSSAYVESDPVLLERILRNLVSNAIRYTNTGKVLVGCRRRVGRLAIEVWDTGVGIPQAHVDDVFDEFFQLPNVKRNRSEGLGLGLSIVKRTAQLLNHPLSMQSELGRGSVFRVEVGVVVAPPEEAASVQSDRSSKTLAGAFVVIIDDEEENRAATEALCRQWGCHVLTAASEQEALEKLGTHLRSPDLIISDYELRDGKNGLDAIETIRSAAGEEIAALVVTGEISALDVRHVSVKGYRLLHKPLDADQLRRAAQAAMPRRVADEA